MASDGSAGHAQHEERQGTAWSLNLGRVSGIPLRIHFTFLLFLGWLALNDTGHGSDKLYGILYLVGILACVMLHELGHSLVAQRFGIGVAEIVLYPIGGLARLERLPRPRQELWIALAGPAVNVVIAALIAGGLAAAGKLVPVDQLQFGRDHWWEKLAIANVVLFVFNMLPAFPMDGGRVLRSLLALRMTDLRATEIAATIGQLLAIALGFAGLVMGNPWLLFIAFFVFVGAGQEANMYRGKALVEGLQASAAMITEFHTLEAGATLREAAELLLHTSQEDFPVVNGAETIGLLTRNDLLRGLADEGPSGYVTAAMSREFAAVAPDSDLEEIASEMQAGARGTYLVMDGAALLGMLTSENLAELLAVRQLTERRREDEQTRRAA